jgi:hypothetical protein
MYRQILSFSFSHLKNLRPDLIFLLLTTLHHITPHHTTLYHTTPHYTTLHYSALYCTLQHGDYSSAKQVYDTLSLGDKRFPPGEVVPVTEEELKIQDIKKKMTHLRLPDSVLKKEILFVNSMESLIEASDVLGLSYSSDTSSTSSSSSSSASSSSSQARVSERMKITTNKLAGVKKGKNQSIAVLATDSNNKNY